MRQSAFILLVEDEDELRMALKDVLNLAHYHVEAVPNVGQAKEAIERNKFDLSLLDVRLPDGNGLDLLRTIRQTDSDNAVIMMTAYADVDLAVDAIRLGADDFIKKPFDMDELLIRIEEILKKRSIIRDNKALNKEVKSLRSQNSLVGQSEAMNKVRQMIDVLGDSESTVLITGESGTGKEVIARRLHAVGTRSSKPFVSINCGAIPEELLESELFGHVKGAFTGAVRARPGRFELANGGVIFLDEIGDMSPNLQVKLLRVLQERCFEPVGSEKTTQIDVRVIAATHRDLEEEISNGRFREDLYYRLNVIPIHLAPLRDRGEDVLLLAEHFIQHFNANKNSEISGMTDEVKKIMFNYSWRGNVRELQNVMERIATLKRSGMIEVQDLPSKMLDQSQRIKQDLQLDIDNEDGIDLKGMVDEYENSLIESALNRFDWNKNRTANFLSLNRTTLVEKIKKKGINPNKT